MAATYSLRAQSQATKENCLPARLEERAPSFLWRDVVCVMLKRQFVARSHCGEDRREVGRAAEAEPAFDRAGVVDAADAGRERPAARGEQLGRVGKQPSDHG